MTQKERRIVLVCLREMQEYLDLHIGNLKKALEDTKRVISIMSKKEN